MTIVLATFGRQDGEVPSCPLRTTASVPARKVTDSFIDLALLTQLGQDGSILASFFFFFACLWTPPQEPYV